MVALSPDGTRAAYGVTINNAPRLVLRSLDSLETRVIESESAMQPFFSPDGLWVGFFNQPTQTLYRVPVMGGVPSVIAAIGTTEFRGATWGEDGTIVFGTNLPSGLWRVSANGGVPEPFTTPDESLGELNHEWPEFLPGGDGLLFAVRRVGQADDALRIVLRELESETQHVLIEGGSYPKYASSGHLVYAIAGTIRAVPFDRTRRAVAGEPVNVVQGVMTKLRGGAEFALAENGALLYISGDVQGLGNRSVVWVDPAGREGVVPTPANAFEALDLSPDGTRAALGTSGDADVWISDLARGTLERLTVDPGFDGSPLWSPDGERIVFASNRSGPFELLWQLADGSAAPDTLATFDASVTNVVPGTWSPDGTRLIAAVGSTTQLDIGMVTVGEPESWQWLLQTPASERNPALSSDGRWLAYGSNRTGAYEVYVQRFPGGGGRQQVSVGGGHTPRWSADGRTLTYVRALAPGNPVAVTRVAVSGGTTEDAPLAFGSAMDLFSYQQYFGQPGGQWWFDMTPDGTRFLMIRGNVPGRDSQPTLVFVHNWFSELEQLVPTH
jgi:serine/threonine-protein kinase